MRLLVLIAILLSLIAVMKSSPQAQDVFITAEGKPSISSSINVDSVLPLDFSIAFYYQNNSNSDIDSYSATWVIYSPDTVINISYRNIGGETFGFPEYLVPTVGNGWRPSSIDDYYWSEENTFSFYSFDGNLPDTFNHTASSLTRGWPAEDNYNIMRFEIGVWSDQLGTICIDSVNFESVPGFNWLWSSGNPTWNNGEPFCIVICDPPNSIDNNLEDTQVPLDYELGQNSPNPFNLVTRIDYSIKTASHVELSIYNQLGQKIRTLVNTSQPANSFSVTWDGLTDSGDPASSGIYLYKIKANEFVSTKKMLLLK